MTERCFADGKREKINHESRSQRHRPVFKRSAGSQVRPVLGRIRYDEAVTAAQVKRMSVVESGDSPASIDIRALWMRVKTMVNQHAKQA